MRNKLIGGLGLVLIVLLAGGFVYRRETALLTVKLGGFSPDGYGATFMVQNNTERNISIRQGRVEIKTATGWVDIVEDASSSGKPDSLLLISNLPRSFGPKGEAEWLAVIPLRSHASYRAAIDCARGPAFQTGWRKYREALEDRVFGSPSNETHTVYSAEFTR